MPKIRVWVDSRRHNSWIREYARMPAVEKLVIENSLRELLQTLKICEDPLRDRALRQWRPTVWAVASLRSLIANRSRL